MCIDHFVFDRFFKLYEPSAGCLQSLGVGFTLNGRRRREKNAAILLLVSSS
jgi:hypothetical protein